MNEQEITEYLQDNDGTTRDITFTPSSLQNLFQFLELFLSAYRVGELTDQNGEIVEKNLDAILKKLQNNEGCIHGQLIGSNEIIGQVHLFIDWPEEGGFAVEISFFSEDLRSDFTLSDFLSQLNEWWELLQTKEIFVRYENASWDYYDSKGLGVFYHDKRN